MRILIWQEFSSNNSARFTVVGIFETATAAQNAANKLMDMVKSILEWYQKPENASLQEQWPSIAPSPPEIQIAKQYNIEWSQISLDWAWLDDEGNGPVKTFENIVFVDGTESWLGSSPADKLVQRLGGKALVDGTIIVDEEGETEAFGTVNVKLLCIAPNEVIARRIYDEIVAYLEIKNEDVQKLFDAPWQKPMEYSAFDGTAKSEGRNLEISGTFFHIAEGFPALIDYLRNKGCEEIHYSFIETRESFQ